VAPSYVLLGVLGVCAFLCDNFSPNGGNPMPKRLLTVFICVLALSLSSLAATRKSAKKAAAAGSAPDKAYLQQIWDGWSSMDTTKVAPFYASGDHTFYDLAPLKYSSWQEYEQGVKKLLANYKSLKFTVNDDAQMHRAGEYAWGTATVKEDGVTSGGKHEMATIRWTVVFENQGGKWLVVHEHVSEPLQ
jgi:ketosteroid isomerase-like protein